MSEWNLSDKRTRDYNDSVEDSFYVYSEEDVREFIKRLKDKVDNAQKDYANLDLLDKEVAIEIINKLAGEKLI